jgi:hypothetical protein
MLTQACFQIDVENRDYHHLSRFEIDGAKRISQHLSGTGASFRFAERISIARLVVRFKSKLNFELSSR